MDSLRQQLEVQRQHNDDVDSQLRTQYKQAVCSLREALGDVQQKELDAVVGQLQELHQRQLQQLHAQHLHDSTLQVTAMRVTVEQVQESRIKLLQDEHQKTIATLRKQHKEQLNSQKAGTSLSNGDKISPLAANEELTRRYEQLVQKINQTLETEVLLRLHTDNDSQDESGPQTNGISSDPITAQQAEAIQQMLQSQLEEVLSLRSQLLAEYESMLQQRSAGVTEQTAEIAHLQEEMTELQQQYEEQILEFQTRLAKYNDGEEREALKQQRDLDLEKMKAEYEQRIADLELSFTSQIAALQQAAILVPSTTEDIPAAGRDSNTSHNDSLESDSENLPLRLMEEREYVQKTTTLTTVSDIDSDTADSPQSSAERDASSRFQELKNRLEEKGARISELEKCLEEERTKVASITEELNSASQKLVDLSGELQLQREICDSLQQSVGEKDKLLEQAQLEKAESDKLLREYLQKESNTVKEKEDLQEQLRQLKELGGWSANIGGGDANVVFDGDGDKNVVAVGGGDHSDVTDSSSLDEQVKVLRASLAETASALQMVESREKDLKEKLEDAEHQHREALEALRQELEHEAKVERETMQSEFRVQLDVELKRQAAELEQQSTEEEAADSKAAVDSTQADDVEPVQVSRSHSGSQQFQGDTNVVTGISLTYQSASSLHSSSSKSASDETEQPTEKPTGEATNSRLFDVARENVSQTDTSTQTLQTNADSTPINGASRDTDPGERADLEEEMDNLKLRFELERTQLVETYEEQVAKLKEQLSDAEDRYNRLKEDIEEHEGAGVEQLLKDRYDMELELTKNLMQQEFDDTMQAEKKKFVERHRKLMDEFMSDRESEAKEIREKHEQELDYLNATIAELQSQLQQGEGKSDTAATAGDKTTQAPETGSALDDVASELEGLQGELRQKLALMNTQHEEALTALREEYEARIEEMKSQHQEQLEAAALDTDVMKSELDLAHQVEIEALRQQLATWSSAASVDGTYDRTRGDKTQKTSRSSKDGDRTPDVRSSLEYEETDEEGSVHSFSSMIGKQRSFADVVKSPPPSSPQQEQRIKQLEAQIERLTEQLVQQQSQEETMMATKSTIATSPPPKSPGADTRKGSQGDGEAQNALVVMLQSDLERISAERDAIQHTNNRLLQLLSDSVHTYVEVEDTINRRLHIVVSSSTPSQWPGRHDNAGELVTPRGAGMSSFPVGAMCVAGAMSSPRSDRSWRGGDRDSNSPTLEETSILSNATDEGLDVSQRLTESIFAGPDIDAEGEEIVTDARSRLQNAVSRLLEMIERSTQQLLEAKTTQADLLETMAARSRDNDDLKGHIHDLEEQLRQEVSAKEYLGLELHKAEGLISGYSSERETMEEQLQLLEEQKEVLANDLETTRSRLQDFQEAAGELEARRQDLERNQTLLEQNAGQEAQALASAGGDANSAASKALLTEVNTVKQETREQTLQLQHRLAQSERRLQEREAALEEIEREQNRQLEELRRQVEDLTLQLDNTDRQLKSTKVFLDEQMNDREQEREEFQREVETLKTQLLDKEKQEGSHGRLQREVQELAEQLQARIDKQSQMHQQAQQLQQSLEERDLSAQDLRVWINSLEKELDQRSDTEQQLKNRIGRLEQQLSKSDIDAQSDKSASPMVSPRHEPTSPVDLSPTLQFTQRHESRISLEEELRKSRQSEEELVHEKEALQKTVQEQLLQISALRNQLDEMRHWTGPQDTNASASSAADLREQLESEREASEKKDEEIVRLKEEQEEMEKELEEKEQTVEELRKRLQDNSVASDHLKQREKECQELKDRIAELSSSGPFPPELLEEKNAEIEELRQQLSKAETDLGSSQAQLKQKEELVSDLQDTIHSLQRGETCLDVSLPFNEPVPLNASFTERPPDVVRPESLTSLAQELDQTVSEKERHILELTSEMEQLTSQVSELQEKIDQLEEEKTSLAAELHQRDEDVSQKQEALVEKESRLEQLVGQINSLQTEITCLTTFQVELQKDFDTVQSMLDEKEKEIESLTRELLDSRSQPDGSDMADLEAELAAVQRQLREQRNVTDEKEEELYELQEKLEAMDSIQEEVKSLKSKLHEKEAELEREKKSRQGLQEELDEVMLVERARDRANSFPSRTIRPFEEQVKELKAEILHLQDVIKAKEELIRYLEEEKATDTSILDKGLVELQSQQDELNAKFTRLQKLLEEKEQKLLEAEKERDDAILSYQQEVETLQQQVRSKSGVMEHLEVEARTLRQQAEEKEAAIQELQELCQKLREEMQSEVDRLQGQVQQLSSVAKDDSIVTDDAKALEDRLNHASEELAGVTQKLHNTQTRLEQTSTQLSEREEQIQQLQAEVQAMQQEARRRVEEQERVRSSTPESRRQCKTSESSQDGVLSEDQLQDVLARAQKMQALVRDSLSSSLPLHADPASLVRWDSEPGLSRSNHSEISSHAQDTEVWLRRQQRELASKNRDLAKVRQELEEWLKHKDAGAEQATSIMNLSLRLQEKESIIVSLKRELLEAKELLAATEKSEMDTSHSSTSHSLSPQTKQQIAHLRSELRHAKTALAALQGECRSESETSDAGAQEDRDRLQKLEAELKLLRSSSSMSARDFVKKVQELRDELTREHQQHIRDIQEAARQDTDVKLTELQARHDHEIRQLHYLHERKMEQALSEQHQELEKQHKTELNNLRVKHQQQIDRLRDEELASLTDSSVTQRLQADVAATQQMDQRMLGSLVHRSEGEGQDEMSTAETSSTVSGSDDALPARLQALLDRLRELGDHVLSVSELDFLQRHLSPEREVGLDTLQRSWEGEKLGLVKTIHALKELLSQADRVGAELDEAQGDWRSELVHALVEVYKRERLALEAELHTLRLQHANRDNADIIKIFDNRLREQDQLHQSGLDAMLRAERQSLLAELEEVHARLVQQRREEQQQRQALSEALAQQEENASNTQWKLQRQVQVLEYKLQQEKVIEEDLKKGLETERRRVAELSTELSRDKGSLISLQSELQSTQIHLSRTKDALEREQNRFTSVTDALEEEREKNNRLADMLETMRRQNHSLESDVGRSEAMRKEREKSESKFIKELQAELLSEHEHSQKALKVAEEERQKRQRAETELEREQEQASSLSKELEKLRRQTKKALDAEAVKMQELQKLLKQEQNETTELQKLLQGREATIAHDANRIKDLQALLQQLQRSVASLEQQLETERQKAASLVAIMDSEREKQAALQEQEQNTVRQLRHDLNTVKTEASEIRRHLELERSHADGLKLELERAQSELRALTQHAGATERQLESEHSTTWNNLRLAQRERDDLQMKVHELGLELERLQDRLQDLELELDRSRQRELEARHDVERQKLYPTASPRLAADVQASTTDSHLQKRLAAFCQQLQTVGHRLSSLAQRQRHHNDTLTITESEDSDADGNRGRSAVEAVITELQDLQKKMLSGDEVDAVPVRDPQVAELEKRVSALTREREELQRRLTLLEDEDNRRTPRTSTSTVTISTSNAHRSQQASMPQYVSDAASDDEFLYERTVWASERLSLQMSLDSAEHEIDRLKKELRQFRSRYDSEGFMVETDRDKMQRLYGKYLRAESFRKALVYQKKYLLILLGGYQDSEQETLAIIATMGGQPSSTLELALRRRHRRLYTMFRSAARMVVAIFRMKYLVRKWKRAMRIGSPVVSGRVNQQYGYMATSSSFSPPNSGRQTSHPSSNSATSAYVHTLLRSSTVANGSAGSLGHQGAFGDHLGARGGEGMGRRFYTPPTKDPNQSNRSSASSSSARRQLIQELGPTRSSSSGAEDSGGGHSGGYSSGGGGGDGAVYDGGYAQGGGNDDFIQRLENLQSRLSQTGNGARRSAWR